MLAALRRAHPRLQIELSLLQRQRDGSLAGAGLDAADVAVRMAQPTQSALVAKRVGTVKLGVFASAAYLVDHAVPSLGRRSLCEGTLSSGRTRDASFFRSPCCRWTLHASGRTFAVYVRTVTSPTSLGHACGAWDRHLSDAPLAAGPRACERVLPKLFFNLPVWPSTHPLAVVGDGCPRLRASRRVVHQVCAVRAGAVRRDVMSRASVMLLPTTEERGILADGLEREDRLPGHRGCLRPGWSGWGQQRRGQAPKAFGSPQSPGLRGSGRRSRLPPP